jgi:phosphatidylcholine synthase
MSDLSEHIHLPASERPSRRRVRLHPALRKLLAWGVHFYTATGLILAAAMAVAILHGTPESFRAAFVLMLVATLVDATDGTFARLIKIKETLPGFDGRRLDDLVDFQTYVTLPLLLIWQARLLPPGQEGWLVLPLLAAAYGFCQVDAKTPDGYFLGFPSYWNIAAFYLYVLQPPPGLALGLLVALALLTFVPFRYLYPTQPGRLNRVTNQLAAAWCVLLVVVLWLLPSEPPPGENADTRARLCAALSLVFPAYYLVISWGITAGYWRRRRRERKRQKAAVGGQ